MRHPARASTQGTGRRELLVTPCHLAPRAHRRLRRRRSRRPGSIGAARAPREGGCAASGSRTATPRRPRGRSQQPFPSALADRDARDDDRFRRRAVGDAEGVDALDGVHAVRHLADDCVLGWEARVVAGHDEELAARRPRRLDPGLRHRNHAPRVGGVRGRHVDGRVAGAARARLGRIAALDHEPRHDAMEDRVVEVAGARERHERRRRLRREPGVERHGERPATRVEHERVRLRFVERCRRCLARARVARRGRLDAHALRERGGSRGRRRLGCGLSAPATAGEERRGDEHGEEGAHGLRSYPSMSKLTRCEWAAEGDELMLAYHDSEWGVPSHDDRHLFELLILEGAQAGLSWSTILRKRENYRRAFAGFKPELVAGLDPGSLLADPGIVRNRLKVESAISNAGVWLEQDDPVELLWSFVGGEPKVNAWRTLAELPAETDESRAMSKELKRRGFRFVGPTICYSLMQACGLVDDHTTDCFRRVSDTP